MAHEYEHYEPDLPLFRCLTCGTVVLDREAHDRWTSSLRTVSVPMTPSMIEDRLLPPRTDWGRPSPTPMSHREVPAPSEEAPSAHG